MAGDGTLLAFGAQLGSHPVEASLDRRHVVIEEEYDVLPAPPRPELFVVPAAPSSRPRVEDVEIIVASPKLASAWRQTKQPKDLSEAPFVAHTNVPSSNRRRFRSSTGKVQHLAPSEPRIVANATEAIRSLVVGGVGFAVVPSQVVLDGIETGRVGHVLPQWRGRVIRIQLCRPSLEHPPARVVAFVRELRSVFTLMGYKARYTDAALRYALRPPP